MKLIRYNPPMPTLRDWDVLFGDPFRLFSSHLASARRALEARPTFAGVEWYEDDSHFHARVDLPGLKRENLRLDAEEGLLRLRHEVASEGENGATESSRSEFVLRCPEGVRTDGIEARLADGILEISLPKVEARKPQAIEIR